jgi:hypothetical protein
MAPGTYDIQAVCVPSGSFNFVLLITFRHPLSQIMSAFMVLENVVLALNRVRDVVLVVTGHLLALKYATLLSLRFTVCLIYQQLSSELLIMHPTVHLACHTPLNSMHAFEHDKRCRQCLHGAKERLVTKQSVCRPDVKLWVWSYMLRISM